MKYLSSRRWLLVLLVTLILLVGQWAVPGFTSPAQFANQLKIATFLGLFGLSQTIVMMSGGQGLDLSVGAAATLGGILGAAMIGTPGGLAMAFIAAVLCGVVIGGVNGVGIVLLRVPPLVMTLAMASLIDGALIVWSSIAHANTAASPALVNLSGRDVLGVPSVVVLWVLAAALSYGFLELSTWGRRLKATGANPVAAWITGIRVPRLRVMAYIASAIIAAVTGLLLVGYVGQAFLGLGNAYVLTSVVVAVIGGVSLAGGRGDYLSVVLATIFITVLTSLLTALQIGEAGRQGIFGVTLLVFLGVNRLTAMRAV